MATATRKVKPIRKLTVAQPLANGYLIVCITEGSKCDHYRVTPVSSDWGRAFRWEKLGDHDQAYDVLLGEDGQDCCGCRGFSRFGYCRHWSASRKLVELKEVGS